MTDLLERIQDKLLADPALLESDPVTLARIIREEAPAISDVDVLALLRRLRDDSAGAGQLNHVLASPDVTDVLVNGPDEVWVDHGNGLERTDVSFHSDAEVRALATRLATACGRRLDDAHPFADGQFTRPDGTTVRVHAILAPPSQAGTCLSLRVLRQANISVDDLLARGTIDPARADFLCGVIEARASFLVVGGTGSGKTTLLSAMLGEVAHTERIVCIEDTAELRPSHPHVVNLVTRPANTEGTGAITMTQLLAQALRMRPDRIVVGEIRGAEVVDLLAALNTGHAGGAGTIHANTTADVPARLEALAAVGGMGREALHAQLASAVDLVLAMRRGGDGQRRLAEIAVLEHTPVSVRPIWTHDDGPAPGYQEVATRLGVTF